MPMITHIEHALHTVTNMETHGNILISSLSAARLTFCNWNSGAAYFSALHPLRIRHDGHLRINLFARSSPNPRASASSAQERGAEKRNVIFKIKKYICKFKHDIGFVTLATKIVKACSWKYVPCSILLHKYTIKHYKIWILVLNYFVVIKL